ncbi:MAG TPA: TIGR02996 domain-containing protein [Gemmataceae bacterium]|nr:TIGR02996 domain-containing protein [Gemmataceae bacterium]
MSEEAAFLRAIQANPKDDVPRLVYADWLDERGDEHSRRKAAFLRLTAKLMTTRSRMGRAYWETKLRPLAPALDSKWLSIVSKMPIEACNFQFAFRCPKRWENLRPTTDPNVRRCDTCQKPVHFSATAAEARDHARRGECVAVSLAFPRTPGDLHNPGRRFTSDEIRALGRPGVLGRIRTQEIREDQYEGSGPTPDGDRHQSERTPPKRRRRERRRRNSSWDEE